MARKKLFKNMTIREQMKIYLSENGYVPVESRSGKYDVMYNIHYIFLGKSGAVRVSSRNCVTGSNSYTPQFKKAMEKWAKEKGLLD